MSPIQSLKHVRGEPHCRLRLALLGLLACACALLFVPTVALADPPQNDEYASWFDEALGFPESQSTTDATATGEPMTPGDAFGCRNDFDGGVRQMGATVWYRVKGSGRDITLSASGFDTMMTVYDTDGSAPPTDDNIITCNDDATSGETASRLTFASDLGSKYLVQVGGCCDSTPESGDLTFVATSPPANDSRANATPLVAGTPALADNLGAVTDGGEDTRCEGALPQDIGKTVWFKYTAPSTGDATFASAGFDTILQVYRGGETTPLGCNDDGDPDHPKPSRLKVRVTPGEYYVQVGGCCSTDGGAADGELTMTAEFQEDLDVDRDGSQRPADCNDSDPGIKPGAVDTPHDNVDQDCQGGDNLDGDGDGFATPGNPQDCNDANPAIKPGAREVRGNYVDENCDGRAPAALLAPFPLILAPNLAYEKHVVFKQLLIKRLRRGYRITVRCRGRGCPGTQRRTAHGTHPIGITAYHNRSLRPGATITVSVVQPHQNRIGAYTTYRTRSHRRQTQRLDRCIFPAAPRSPKSCPSA